MPEGGHFRALPCRPAGVDASDQNFLCIISVLVTEIPLTLGWDQDFLARYGCCKHGCPEEGPALHSIIGTAAQKCLFLLKSVSVIVLNISNDISSQKARIEWHLSHKELYPSNLEVMNRRELVQLQNSIGSHCTSYVYLLTVCKPLSCNLIALVCYWSLIAL